MSRRTKVAAIRRPGNPVGTPGPMYLNCPCGAEPAVPEEGEQVVCDCGVQYDARGWIVASATAVTASYRLVGVTAMPVSIRCAIQRGPARWAVSGLSEVSIKEVAVRVRSAFTTIPWTLPDQQLAVDVTPSLKSETSVIDLAVACAVLIADGMKARALDGLLIAGELGLDGTVRRVKGTISACELARSQGMRGVIVPSACAHEALEIEGLEIYPAEHLSDVVRMMSGEHPILPASTVSRRPRTARRDLDMVYVPGQEHARRALEIAAAGGHSILLEGPPGTGKTMLARRLPTILPPMTREEEIETLRVFSACGLLEAHTPHERPFRAPHHTISVAAMRGGGASTTRPGEVSLAHNGVLFLDELDEFPKASIDGLREPMDTGVVTRTAGTVTMPARFHLVAAVNPCPCGWLGSGVRECTCSPSAIERFRQHGRARVPLDMRAKVTPVSLTTMRGAEPAEPSDAIRARVVAAREIQLARFHGLALPERVNADMSPVAIDLTCPLDEEASYALHRVAGYDCPDGADCGDPGCDAEERTRLRHRILRVARTIADLAGTAAIGPEHIKEAASFVRETPTIGRRRPSGELCEDQEDQAIRSRSERTGHQ